MGRKGIEFVVSELEREQLLSMSRSRSLPHSLVRRAKIVLMAAEGHTNQEIAVQCEVTSPAITHWKSVLSRRGLLVCMTKRARGDRAHDDEAVAELLAKVLHEKPDGKTHWSVRSAAAQTGISKRSVSRYLSPFGVQPHRSKSFKLSTDPYFVEKVRDIVGLYLSPPTNALVLCVDEKSQCQALERTQPVLPMGLGYLEGVTHDYTTHKHPKVKEWLAKHTRYHMHFTPTYSSWLNQVERWFGLITQQAIRRGSFRNVRQLIASIERYVAQYNQHNRPFVWTATADSILQKVARLCKVISGTEH